MKGGIFWAFGLAKHLQRNYDKCPLHEDGTHEHPRLAVNQVFNGELLGRIVGLSSHVRALPLFQKLH